MILGKDSLRANLVEMKKTMNNVHKTSSPPFFYNHLLKRRHLGQNMLFYLNQNHAILAYKRKVLFF